MNILIEIGHPAHVHFFGEAIHRLEAQGVKITLVTRNKEITDALLRRAGFSFRTLSSPAQGKAAMARELLGRWQDIRKVIREDHPDLVCSISGISTSFPARWAGVRNIMFTDTEDAVWANRIAFAFADAIYTPQFFLNELGAKQRRYAGLHELTYLQSINLDTEAETRRQLGFRDRYIILRQIAHDALHDQDIRGLSETDIQRLIEKTRHLGRVYITSQSPLPAALQSYLLKVPIESMHAVLGGAELFIGESPTMAVESSLLGVPAFLISQRVKRLGNMLNLERLGLLRNFICWSDAEKEIPSLEVLASLKASWSEKARAYRTSAPDMTEFLVRTLLDEAARGRKR